MSARAKKAALAITISIAATVLVVACATAQLGPGTPSGGTKLRMVSDEGHSSLGPVGLMSRQLALPVAWQGAFGSFVASQIAYTFVSRTDTRAVARRAQVKR